MRILEVLEESRTDEAPVGGIRQGLRKLGSAAAGAVGATGLSANLSGKVAAGNKANQLFVAYNKYIGQQNKSFNDADAGDLKDFLATKNISDQYVSSPDTDILTKDEINDIMIKVATDSFKRNRPTSQSSGGSAANIGSIMNSIKTLDPDEQQQLLDYLTRSLKTQAPSVKKEPTINPSNVIDLKPKDTNVSI